MGRPSTLRVTDVRCGDVYMVQLIHPSDLYGWWVSRVWYMPWRYNLHLMYIRGHKDVVTKRLTKVSLVGMLRLLDLIERE